MKKNREPRLKYSFKLKSWTVVVKADVISLFFNLFLRNHCGEDSVILAMSIKMKTAVSPSNVERI